MFVCLDIETTGLNPKDDHIIEVAIVRFDHEKILEEWSSLVRPPVPIPEFTTRLTGITNEMVKNAPPLHEIGEFIDKHVGEDPIMGHFIVFDINFLEEHGLLFPNLQLDTCQLSQVLLPNEASYSLEVLAEKLGVKQPDAHRAMDDVKANIELFWKLSAHIRTLSDKEKDSIRPILKKSDWSWAPFLLPLLDEKNGELIKASSTKKKIHSEKHADLEKLCKDISPPFLFEEASYTDQDLLDYALTLDDKTLLVVPDLALFPANKETGPLKHPNQYIDEDRLKVFLSKERLNETEAMLGTKAKLWLHHTKTGEKSEIKIIKEENREWFNICCQESDTPNSFYKRAQELAFEKKVVVIDHSHFLKERSRKEPSLPMPKHLVIGQIERFVKEIESAWHIILNESRFLHDLHRLKTENPDSEEVLDHLAAKISILFGLIGMVIQKHGMPEDPRHVLILEAHHRNTPEWNKVSKSAESIEAAISALGDDIKASPSRDEFERYILYLSKILQTSGPILWTTATKDGYPILHAFPEESSSLFKERVWKNTNQLHLFCHHGELRDDFSFLKEELGLPEEIQTHSSKEAYPLPLISPETKISSPNDPKNVKEATHELSIHIPKIEGNVFLFVTSKRTAESFYYSLQELIEKTGRKLFVQNLSGGLGKITQMSKKTDGSNFFVGDINQLKFLLDEGIKLNFLAVHRLPFSHPGNPIQIARNSKYNNAYKEFTLPQAALRLQSIINSFLGNEWEGKKILILDARIDSHAELFLPS